MVACERPEIDSGSATDAICPTCEQGAMDAFYEVRNIPVHSVLLMKRREDALNYPRRDLRLGFCRQCGFIANTCFDPSAHEYGTSCEETQGFSPTFRAFSEGLAKRWVEQYKLYGKTVLEIGCGKGEFLTQLVEQGAGKGIGIDPAFVPERLSTPAVSRLEFTQDLYSEKYTHIESDVICCRHTLEHIARTAHFMRLLRRATGTREVIVLFELPDVLRVLKEAAFWDIYYEHCSYFTKGSLARLFRRIGFEVLDLKLEYDGQYILITGRPTLSAEGICGQGEDDLDEVTNEVTEFPARFAALKKEWLSRIDNWKKDGKSVVLWCGGSKAVSFLTTLGLGEQINAVVDINPYKQGKFIPGTGHAVVSPEELKQRRPDYVILMNPIYVPEVRARLEQIGLKPRIVAV
jgi:SAM-dependent methyltransferase